jgi:hypothetical protein
MTVARRILVARDGSSDREEPLRDADDRVLAAASADDALRPTPTVSLNPRTLLGKERRHQLGRRGLRLPESGGRLRLAGGRAPLWLDVWEGDADGLSGDEHGAFVVAAAMLRFALRPEPALRRLAS